MKLIYPLFGLKKSLHKLQKKQEVTDLDLLPLISFIDCFTTVSLHPAIVGPIVAKIAEEVNQHGHTKTCRKYITACRFKFPKLPSYRTVIATPQPDHMPENEDEKKAFLDMLPSQKRLKTC